MLACMQLFRRILKIDAARDAGHVLVLPLTVVVQGFATVVVMHRRVGFRRDQVLRRVGALQRVVVGLLDSQLRLLVFVQNELN